MLAAARARVRHAEQPRHGYLPSSRRAAIVAQVVPPPSPPHSPDTGAAARFAGTRHLGRDDSGASRRMQ